MKIEAFFKWIQNNLLNYPDINLNTVMLFVDKFYYCLSIKEKNKFKLPYQVIKELTNRQITLDTFVHKTKVNILEKKLNEIKNDKSK